MKEEWEKEAKSERRDERQRSVEGRQSWVEGKNPESVGWMGGKQKGGEHRERVRVVYGGRG